MRVRLLLPALTLALGACGSSSDSGNTTSFVVRTTPHAADTTTTTTVRGVWLVYYADEALTSDGMGMPTNLNPDGDSDTTDTVAFRVNMSTQALDGPGVACRQAEILSSGDTFLVVDESADGRDWSMPADGDMDDVVLLHYVDEMTPAVFVDELDATQAEAQADRLLVTVVGDELWYTSSTDPATEASASATSLKRITADDPTGPVTVEHAIAGTLRPRLWGVDEELLFLLVDETRETTDFAGGLNDVMLASEGSGAYTQDTDATDTAVVALVDRTDPAAPLVRVTGVAVEDDTAEYRAGSTGTNDWLVSFLVSEAAQGPNDLDDPALFVPAWQLAQCPGTGDGSTDEDVLFHLDFSAFVGGALPVNTGLAGTRRVLVSGNYVGTLVSEDDADCWLNVDMAQDSDTVLRWVNATTSPVLPPDQNTALHAIALLGDESMGVASLSGRWVTVVDELGDGVDHDMSGGATDDLMASFDPAGLATTWEFMHVDPDPQVPSFSVGVDWMGDRDFGGRLPIALQESVVGQTVNRTCGGLYDDGDMVDIVSAWTRLNVAAPLTVPGVGYAMQTGNPGMVMTTGHVYIRVDEMEHGGDFNQDGDLDDAILLRAPTGICTPTAMATLNDLAVPAVVTDRANGASFLAEEASAGVDLNGDGDIQAGEHVVRYFLF
jgi:hypothetical protein